MDSGRLLRIALLVALPPATEAKGPLWSTIAGVPLLNYDVEEGSSAATVDERRRVRRSSDEEAGLAYERVHGGHCAAGWLGGNTRQNDVFACAQHCSLIPQCGFFAYASVTKNCALYDSAADCPDDGKHPDHTAYRLIREVPRSVWMLLLNQSPAGDSPLQSICAALGRRCQWATSTEAGGSPMVVAKATFQELEAFLTENPGWASIMELVEADSPIAGNPSGGGTCEGGKCRPFVVPWHLNRVNQHRLNLDGNYPGDFDGGRGVHVYVLDTGIRSTHVEFQGRAVATWDFARSGGNLTNCSAVRPAAFPECAEDDHGHGTHVAGLVGGKSYGVARGSTLHSVKVLRDNNIGEFSWIVHALDLVQSFGLRPAVVCASLGARGASRVLQMAVESTVAAGITVVVGAANSNEDACTWTPASIPSAITVGASTRTDHRASFSNYGGCVDLFAPGVDMESASLKSDTAIGNWEGTSFACPLVAGAVALRLSARPRLSPSVVVAELLQTATSDVLADVGQGSPNLLLFAPVLR